MSWLHGAATRFKLFFAARATEQRIDRELDFHITMETERLVREFRIDATEARRRALATFGGQQQHRESLRRGRGTAWLSALSLDAKLGLRMLAKYPGLTLVGVLGISIAVAVGTLAYIAAVALSSPTLPLDEGERVVTIINRDIGRNVDINNTHLHSLDLWRSALRTVDNLGAWKLAQRNVIPPGHAPASMLVAEMTASAFRLARVHPIHGRYFTDDDERQGAPDVAVIGEDTWRRMFDGRADIIGSIVQLGLTRHTIVGVMPAGFAFPFNNEIWTPLRLNATAYQPAEAPPLFVIGRLAPDASLDDAQRELTMLAPRVAELVPSRRDSVRTVVMPYTSAFFRGEVAGMGYGSLAQRGQVIVILLLLVIATNVAVLVYARTASRVGEMAVRTALGASRTRIVAQLFMEALILSGASAIVGLVIAHFALQQSAGMLQLVLGRSLPYWIRLEVTPGVALYVAGLAVFAAMIIGAIPGLKATRHRVAASLKGASANASMRLGRTWTVLLVTQVAISVAVLPIAQFGSRAWLDLTFLDFASPMTSHTVIARPQLDQNADAYTVTGQVRQAQRTRYTASINELERRLEQGGGIRVMRMSSAPDEDEYMRIELDSTEPADTSWSYGPTVRSASVEPDFFDAFDIKLLAGRTFVEGDASAGANTILVNQAFANRFFARSGALGHRFRRFRDAEVNGVRQESQEPWWEIVGIVDEYPKVPTHTPYPKAYLPLPVGETLPVTLVVHAPGIAPSVAGERIRSIALDIDPTLRLGPIRSLESRFEDGLKAERLGILALVLVTVSVVLLSTAGMYALVSFTVTRRRREIGIRSALGAGSGRVLVGVLSQAMWQIGTGVALGVVGAPLIAWLAGNADTPRQLVVNALGLIATMVVVGALATVRPALQALRVHPTEALRAE